jgi:hypothetical protein
VDVPSCQTRLLGMFDKHWHGTLVNAGRGTN